LAHSSAPSCITNERIVRETGDGLHRKLAQQTSSESRLYVTFATDALMMALEIEGWMTQQPRTRQFHPHCFEECRL
jgi:hypothetical protein